MVELSQTTIYILWAVLIVGFGVLESITAQLVSIWFMIGSIASLIAALLGAGIPTQLIIFIAVSALTLVITRPLVKKYIHPTRQCTNADRVIGQTGIVTEDINNIEGMGQVKADGKIWTARAADNSIIPKSNEVIIEKIDGVKLIVKNKN